MTRGRNPRRETRSPGDEGRGSLENERENPTAQLGRLGSNQQPPG